MINELLSKTSFANNFIEEVRELFDAQIRVALHQVADVS